MGAAIVAAEAGEDPDRAARRWRAERTLALGRTQRLAHLVGVNGFYAALVRHARSTPGAELVDWLTEAEATRWADGIVRPDASGPGARTAMCSCRKHPKPAPHRPSGPPLDLEISLPG